MSEVRIPEGYKQTEVGVIPQNWETKNIGKDATLKARIGWQALTTNEYQSTGNYYLVTGTDFNAGEVQWDTCWYVDEWRYKQDLNIQLRIDDVLVTKDGTIGKVGYVDELPKPATLNSGIFVIRPKYNSFVPKYFFYVLTSSLFKEFIRNITAGSTITHLYQKDFVTFNFPVPPKKEQTAIATALSDIDNLIGSLEKLTAKKEAIKTGTMQQLLTGKTRLPEFATREDGNAKGFKQSELGLIPEDWKVSTLGAIGNFINGRAYSLHEWKTSGTPVIRLQNLTGRGENYYYSDLRLPEKQYCVNGDLLFMWSATFGPVIWRGPKAIFHYHIWKVICESGYSQSYLFYLLSDMTEKLKQSSSSGGTMLHITKQKMESINAAFPNEQEQTAIATILSDIDAEIQALQGRLEKTKDIKQGMMQQLLTGKVRLMH